MPVNSKSTSFYKRVNHISAIQDAKLTKLAMKTHIRFITSKYILEEVKYEQ
jgi:hypothetical protein